MPTRIIAQEGWGLGTVIDIIHLDHGTVHCTSVVHVHHEWVREGNPH